jgi:hypothetical protein
MSEKYGDITSCKICKKEFKKTGLKYHLTHSHKISDKEYYKRFLMQNNENICKMYGKIQTCKKEKPFVSLSRGFYTYCSLKCMANDNDIKNKKENTSIERYGFKNAAKNEEVKLKAKKTNIEKFGVIHPLQLQEFKEKVKQTNLERYGVENVSQLDNIKQKKAETCFDTYGVYAPAQAEVIKRSMEITIYKNYGVKNAAHIVDINEKKIETNLEKYGCKWPTQSEYIKNKIKKTNILNFIQKLKPVLDYLNIELCGEYINSRSLSNWKCTKCSTYFAEKWDYIKLDSRRCPFCYPPNRHKSKDENEIKTFIENIVGKDQVLQGQRNIIKNQATGNFYELDIYLPKYNIAIEFDGLYWHTDKIVAPNYHLTKTIECEKQGIQLIHIFEDEWIFKKEIVKERLKNILNINSDLPRIQARNCEIKEISKTEKRDFLNTYHIQGNDHSKIRIGAFYNNELVSVMTFSPPNISKGGKFEDGIWELNRFCSNYCYKTPGIASKLLEHFKRNYKWKEIFSYADRRWSKGNLYYKIGFNLEHITEPNYWYISNYKRIHRFSLRKRPDEPKDIPEWVLRESQGYHRVWDCGSFKFSIIN